MTNADEVDRRIEQRERELAKMQTEETTYRQIEANLVRDNLKTTLGTAGVIAAVAIEVISGFAAGFDANVQRMAEDLGGSKER